MGTGLAAFAAARVLGPSNALAQAVPNSSGTEAPALKAPPGSCDCHHHIYDAVAFPPVSPQTRMQIHASVVEYRLLQKRLGITRDIVVTPAPYVTDNRVTIDAIKQLGANARGVAVVHPDVTDRELNALNDGGIRGIRFSINDTTIANTRVDMIEPLAKRVAPMGWHVEINMGADQIARLQNLWNRLPAQIVFDHMGHIPQPEGIAHPAYDAIRRLVDAGRAWVKLSVTYDNTKDGPPGYADISAVAQGYVRGAPERMLWGSNWPHPNEINKPDDAKLFDLVAKWAPNEATRKRILVENPETLYGFSKTV
jgi:predicted TIM-barrel fold metal-dependent hydrolase